MMVIFEDGNNMEDGRDNEQCFRGRYNLCSERVYNSLQLGTERTCTPLNTTKSERMEWERKPSTQLISTLTWLLIVVCNIILSFMYSGRKKMFSLYLPRFSRWGPYKLDWWKTLTREKQTEVDWTYSSYLQMWTFRDK